MTIRNLAIAACCLVALGGCASPISEAAPPAPRTEAALAAKLDGLVGLSEAELIRKIGAPPTSTHNTATTKFVTYMESRQHVVPGYAPTYTTRRVYGGVKTTPIGGRPDTVVELRCAITFEIEADRVRAWSYEGNDCRATP